MKISVLASLAATVFAGETLDADIYQELLSTMRVLDKYIEASGRGWNDPNYTPLQQFDAILDPLDSFRDRLEHAPPTYYNIDFDQKFSEFQRQFNKIGGNYATYGGELGGYDTIWYFSSTLWVKYQDIMLAFAHTASCDNIGHQDPVYSSVESCWTNAYWHWNYQQLSSEYKSYGDLPTTNCESGGFTYPITLDSTQAPVTSTQAPGPITTHAQDTYSTYSGAQSTYRCRVVQ